MSESEAFRRLESIKEDAERELFEDVPEDSIGVLSQSSDALTVDICEQLQEVLPEPEPEPVRRYRALVLSMDSLKEGRSLLNEPGDPLRMMQNTAIEYREEALALIEDRLVLEEPTDEVNDAEVIYIYDPVSKVLHTTALGGFKKEYDEAMIEDQKKRVAETILYEPIPDTIPRV